DVLLPGTVEFQESSWAEPGDEIVAVDTPGGRLGLAVFYDLRFSEQFRQFSGKQIELCALPAAVTLATGRDHWEVLVRARAIENQFHLVAANQWGVHSSALSTCGRSLIADAWGTVLATARDGEGLALAEIDLARQRELRAKLPALAHRR